MTTINALAHNILANKRDGKNRPVWIVRFGHGTPNERVVQCHSIEIAGPSRAVYNPKARLGDAACWIETDAEVVTA